MAAVTVYFIIRAHLPESSQCTNTVDLLSLFSPSALYSVPSRWFHTFAESFVLFYSQIKRHVDVEVQPNHVRIQRHSVWFRLNDFGVIYVNNISSKNTYIGLTTACVVWLQMCVAYMYFVLMHNAPQSSGRQMNVAMFGMISIGLYRENAIAIQKESGNSNGGKV